MPVKSRSAIFRRVAILVGGRAAGKRPDSLRKRSGHWSNAGGPAAQAGHGATPARSRKVRQPSRRTPRALVVALLAALLALAILVPTSAAQPTVPTALSAAATGPRQIDLSWTAPSSAGGIAIAGYKTEESSDAGLNWSDLAADTAYAGTTYSHTGLTASAIRPLHDLPASGRK